MKILPTTLLTILICTTLPRAVRAGDEPYRDRARAFVVARIIEALDLPDDRAVALAGILRRGDERRRALEKRRDDAEDALRAALAQAPTDEVRLRTLIAEVVAATRELAGAPQATFAEAAAMLDTVEQAHFLVELATLRDTVRERLGERVQRRRGE